MLNVLWLITARSGSKRLPHKNIKPLGGIPLLAWRILSAKKLGGTIWLSTDSEEYASIGREYGASTPFIRPKELATDGPCHLAAITHAVDFAINQGLSFDLLCVLQPTSPFCSSANLLKGIVSLENYNEAVAAVAVKRPSESTFLVVPEAPYLDRLCERLNATHDYRRQALQKEMTPCGAFYFVRWSCFLKERTLWPVKTIPIFLDYPDIIDIDDDWDFGFADYCITSGRVASGLIF